MKDKPTERQLAFIEDIQECVNKPFTGTTKQDASKYISENIEIYKMLNISTWALENGY